MSLIQYAKLAGIPQPTLNSYACADKAAQSAWSWCRQEAAV